MNINPSSLTTASSSTTVDTTTLSSTKVIHEVPFDKDTLSLTLTKKYIDLLKPTNRQKEISLREFMLEILLDKWEKKVLADASAFVRCFQMIVQLSSNQQDHQANFEGFKMLRALSDQRKYLDYKIQDIFNASLPSQLLNTPALCESSIFPLFEKCIGIVLTAYMTSFSANMQKHATSLKQYIDSEKKEIADSLNRNQREHKKKQEQTFPSDFKLSQETKMTEISLSLSMLSKTAKEKADLVLQEVSSLSRQPVHLMNQGSFHLLYHTQSLAKVITKLIDKNKILIQKIDDDHETMRIQDKISSKNEVFLKSMFTDLMTELIKAGQPDSKNSASEKNHSDSSHEKRSISDLQKRYGNKVEQVVQQMAPEFKALQDSSPQAFTESDLTTMFDLFKQSLPSISKENGKKKKGSLNPKNGLDLSQLYYAEKRKKFEDILAMLQTFEQTLNPCLLALTGYLKHHAEQGTYTKETINLDALCLELISPSEQRTQKKARQGLIEGMTISTSDIEDVEEESETQNASHPISIGTEREMSFLSHVQKEQKYFQRLLINHPYTRLMFQQDPVLATQLSGDHLHHLHQLFYGFNLLQNALHTPGVLPSVLPGLLLDMSALLEHGVLLHYWQKFENLPETHSLTDALRHTKIWSELKDFDICKLVQFNKGTIWARYPSTSVLNYQSQPVPEALDLILKSLAHTTSYDQRIQIFNQMRALMINCLSLQEILLGSEDKKEWRELLKRKNVEDSVSNDSQPVSTQHVALDGLIAKVSLLESTPQIKEAISHLMRFKATLQLANHSKDKYQGVVYRNLFNISIALEQLLQQACLDQGHDFLLSHHLGDFIQILSLEKIDSSNLLSLSIGRALYYPGCYPEMLMVKVLFALEKRAELYRDVEDQFELPSDKHKELFMTSVKDLETRSVKALQDCLGEFIKQT